MHNEVARRYLLMVIECPSQSDRPPQDSGCNVSTTGSLLASAPEESKKCMQHTSVVARLPARLYSEAVARSLPFLLPMQLHAHAQLGLCHSSSHRIPCILVCKSAMTFFSMLQMWGKKASYQASSKVKRVQPPRGRSQGVI